MAELPPLDAVAESTARIARDQAIARLCNRLESYLARLEPIVDALVDDFKVHGLHGSGK